VLDVTNPPSKPVLAIHAGTVRRQAKLQVNQPFVIPNPGSQTGPVEVSLFQQLASHVIANDDREEAFCNIPVKRLDGQSSEVRLRVRRGEAVNEGKKLKATDDIGLTRDYLDHHQLQQRIQSLIQDVLREQPDNPYKYMLDQLKKSRVEPAAAEKQESVPMMPRAPDQPKPDAPRGRNLSAKSADVEPQVASKSQAATRIEEHGPSDVIHIKSVPQTEAQFAARFSVANLLRMPRCQTAAEQSLRNSARTAAAKSICGLAVNSVKEKMVSEFIRPPQENLRKVVRASLTNVFEGAAVRLSPEYQKALCGWARYIAYRGAGQVLGNQSDSRRLSMPTPIVFLRSESSSWGSWLAKSPSSK
jgi:hypothetical protein